MVGVTDASAVEAVVATVAAAAIFPNVRRDILLVIRFLRFGFLIEGIRRLTASDVLGQYQFIKNAAILLGAQASPPARSKSRFMLASGAGGTPAFPARRDQSSKRLC